MANTPPLKTRPIIFNDYAEVVDFVFKALEKFEHELHAPDPKEKLKTTPSAVSLRSGLPKQQKQEKPNQQKAEPNKKSPGGAVNRHANCNNAMGHQPQSSHKQLSPHNQHPTYHPPKSIYQRSMDQTEEHRKHMLIQHIKKIVAQEGEARPSRSHSRSQSRNSHNRSTNKDLNPQDQIKEARNKRISKLLAQLPSAIPEKQPSPQKKTLTTSNTLKASSPNKIRQQKSTTRLAVPARDKGYVIPEPPRLLTTQQKHNKSTDKLAPPNRTPQTKALGRPTTASKSPLTRKPTKSAFQNTLSHEELTNMLNMARSRIKILKNSNA